MTYNDYYRTLELNSCARPEVIKASYKALMQIYHPDMSTGNESIAKKINEAKEVLLDEKLRSEYDKKRNDLQNKTIKDYEILDLISDGDLGTTYKARNILTDGLVCIKHAHYASLQDEELILNEAKTLWDLRHYSIPSMRDIFKLEDGSLALVMSYIPGLTLEQIVKKVGSIEPENVLWIAERSLNALKYLHYNGVIHGDVRPENILIQPDTHSVALVNYGLSAIRPNESYVAKGFTSLYASPEQKNSELICPESDMYSLGLSLIYALGGDVSKREVPSNIPEPICDFLRGMIIYDKSKRPNWSKLDLVNSLQDLRVKVFGRKNSNMKQILGL